MDVDNEYFLQIIFLAQKSSVFILLVVCSMALAWPTRDHQKRSEDEDLPPPQLIQYESTDTDSGHKFSYVSIELNDMGSNDRLI